MPGGPQLPAWLTTAATYGQILGIFVGIIFQVGLLALLLMAWMDFHKFVNAKTGNK